VTNSNGQRPETQGVLPPWQDPELTLEGEELHWIFRPWNVGINFESAHIDNDGVTATLTVNGLTSRGTVLGNLYWGKFNLLWGDGRARVAKELATANPELPWSEMLRYVSKHSVDEIKRGEPVVDLSTVEVDDTMHYLVDHLMPKGETTVIYAQGGVGKSTLASAIALSLLSGVKLPCGLVPRDQGPVLYLDWETHQDEAARRMNWLARGFGVKPPKLLYRYQKVALADDIKDIQRYCKLYQPILVIVDSIGPASGGRPEEAETMIRMFNALRTLAPATRLCLTHVAKGEDDPKRHRTAFGSVYTRELSRSQWEARASEDTPSDRQRMGLFHRKTNYGRLQEPIGLDVIYDEAAYSIRFESADIGRDPDLAQATSMAYRIRGELRRGPKSVTAIAEAIDAKEDSVARTLRRMNDAVRVNPESASGGRGQLGIWALKYGPEEDLPF